MTAMIVEICIKGTQDLAWVSLFEDVEIIPLDAGEFLLRTVIYDQPGLHGLLARVHISHLLLISLNLIRSA